MQFKVMGVTLCLALLTGCGGSGASETSSPTPTAEPQSVETAASQTPAPSATLAETAATPPPAFSQCRACHTVEPGKNSIGPSLFGIVGSKAGDVPGYSFSPALAQSGIVWDPANLDTWLTNPMKMVPGTKMVISQPDPEKRKAIIDYLQTLK
jgi:cytochrome c